ncbi:MAG: hypothetical protein ACYT04_31640 [Nostoc sp.]
MAVSPVPARRISLLFHSYYQSDRFSQSSVHVVSAPEEIAPSHPSNESEK